MPGDIWSHAIFPTKCLNRNLQAAQCLAWWTWCSPPPPPPSTSPSLPLLSHRKPARPEPFQGFNRLSKIKQLHCSCVTVSRCSGLWGVLWPTRCSCLIGSWLPRKPLPLDLSLRWVIENSLMDQTFWINLKMTRRCCLWIIKDFFGRPTILNIFENDPRCCLRTICIQRLPLVSPNMPHCQVQRSNTARWQEFKSKSFVIGKKLPSRTCWSGSGKRWGRESRAEAA